MDKATRPDVRSYLDVYLFLQDIYHFRKNNDPGFSYEAWANEIGVTSRSYLRFATLGKRTISDELTHKFCVHFQFEDSERDYFTHLVLYSQCRNPEQKKIFGRKLTQNLKQSIAVEEVVAEEELVAHPLSMVTRNLLSFTDIEKTPEALAQMLSVDVGLVLKILNGLKEKRLAQEVNGRWEAAHDFVRVPDTPKNQSLMAFHRFSLEKAISAQALPFDQRHYRSLMLALSKKDYQSYLKDLQDFASLLISKYNSTEFSEKRLYQINFNLAPWTVPSGNMQSESQENPVLIL